MASDKARSDGRTERRNVGARTLLVPFLWCAAVFPLVAQSTNAARMANDAYTRSHDYDLIHQRIEVRNFDWDSTSLDGRVTTTLVALRPGLDSVILDAGRLLTVRAEADAKDVTARHAVPLRPVRPRAFVARR